MSDDNIQVKQSIEQLLQFAEQHQLLEHMDVIPARNALLDLLGLDEPYEGRLETEQFNNAVPMMGTILDYAAEHGLLVDDTTTQRDLFDARVMGLLMPRASEIANHFWHLAEAVSIKAATDYFYQLSINSRYIRMDRISQNKHWLAETHFGPLEITINLSKPEKDPREIAAERRLVQSHYPPCVLCIENVGYAGRVNHPARQNHRIIPLELGGEAWFLQYSPYVYYNEHAIILKEEHSPMRIGQQTFVRLLDFVEQFPHYFIGSNADLPIVGGSILNHDHFQAGRHAFPMALAEIDHIYEHQHHPKVKAAIVAWPMSVIRLSSNDKHELLQVANTILDEWKMYSDKGVNIEAFSMAAEGKGSRIPHNTITPIARFNKAGEFELDLVLRNNRTTAEHPFGLFHPHEPLHHIKKENIGLIEVMGLAILPGRLLAEITDIVAILTGQLPLSNELRTDETHQLYKHADWIEELIHKHGKTLQEDQAKDIMERAVGEKFEQVLFDAGVYRRDPAGQAAFQRFIAHLGFVLCD